MIYRTLERSGLKVSVLGMGTGGGLDSEPVKASPTTNMACHSGRGSLLLPYSQDIIAGAFGSVSFSEHRSFYYQTKL